MGKVFESISRCRMKEKLAVALFVLGARFLLFPSKRRIRIVGGVCSDWAGASLRRCTLQQSGKLPNKQMKSTHRHFPLPPQMWLQQMQSWHWRLTQCDNLLCLHSQIHFDLFWEEKRKGGGRSGVDTVHMITHKIMFVSSNSSVTI